MRNQKSQTTSKVRSPRIATLPAHSRTCPTKPHEEPASNNRAPASSIQNPNHQLSTDNYQPTRPRTRNGKIARLPYAVRDMINRMLRNNIPHSQIVAALDEHQIKVTERNLSNWKTRGGYRDWCIEQDRALETRLLQDNLLEHLRKNDASQLAEVGLQLAATQLSQF